MDYEFQKKLAKQFEGDKGQSEHRLNELKGIEDKLFKQRLPPQERQVYNKLWLKWHLETYEHKLTKLKRKRALTPFSERDDINKQIERCMNDIKSCEEGLSGSQPVSQPKLEPQPKKQGIFSYLFVAILIYIILWWITKN